MGVCLSKGHGHHQQGHMLAHDDDGFCTPEGVSSQYESRNPSGRYNFAHLETPRLSADVGDLGALGSLFYKRGSRSRDSNNTSTTVVSNYISPLDMFLGGVSGRNRVHHVNQLCTGDYSFASYLASPLLKGFDVHAMEAVAKSYAESAAKAAARDAFVFLEVNDMSMVSSSSNNNSAYLDPEGCNVSTSSAAAGDDGGDVDDNLAKSSESEEWEEPQPRPAEKWPQKQQQQQETATADITAKLNSNNNNKNISNLNNNNNKASKFRELNSNEKGTSERWVSVLNTIQARARARRRQRRRSASLGKAPERIQRCGSSGRKKSVRFRLAGVEEGFTEEDIRPSKGIQYHQIPKLQQQQGQQQDKEHLEDVLSHNSGEKVPCTAETQLQHPKDLGNDGKHRVAGSSDSDGKGSGGVVLAEGAAVAEEENDNYYIWQEEEEEDDNGDEHETRYGKEKIIEAEFLGFTFNQSGGFAGGGREARPLGGGGATPLMGPRSAPPSSINRPGHIHHPSLESFSSAEYFLPETSFGSAEQLEEEMLLEDFALPPGMEDDDDETMSPGNRYGVVPGVKDRGEFEAGDNFRESTDGEGDDSRQCCFADCGECEAAAAAATAAAAIPPERSGGNGDDACGNSTHPTEEMPSHLYMKDISVSNDFGGATAPPPAIPVGCVVVESRMPDGSRLTPQILELSEVQLPERGEDNYGFFHDRVLCRGGTSSPPSGGSDPNPTDVEGGFSFPVLLQQASSSSSSHKPASPSSGMESQRRGGQWRPSSVVVDPETPIRNRQIRSHLPPPPPLRPSPLMPSTISVRQIHEISSTSLKSNVSEDNPPPSCDVRGSFSFDSEQTVTKRTHEIVLPTLASRTLSPSPVFSPSKVTTSSLRSSVAAAASAGGASSPFMSSIQVSSIPFPPRARRTLNRKLKFYSLERASYAASGAKRSKSPPSFIRQCRERRRDNMDGESDSDLFEIETMSGTNAMGSSRTPPSTPTKTPMKWMPPAGASFDLDKLSDSIARVSRSRSRRGGSNNAGGGKALPSAQLRDSKARCLPAERRKDSSVFQGRGGGLTTKTMSQSSLKGRAMLKLGLLMRSSKQLPHVARSDFRRDSETFRSSDTNSSVSEYLENRPPSPGSGRYHHHPHGQCGQCLREEEREAAAAAVASHHHRHNYAFEWYCSSMAQRVAPLHHEKRLQQQQGLSSHKSFSNEDRTFAVKN